MKTFVKIMGLLIILLGVIQIINNPMMSNKVIALVAIIIWGALIYTSPKSKY